MDRNVAGVDKIIDIGRGAAGQHRMMLEKPDLFPRRAGADGGGMRLHRLDGIGIGRLSLEHAEKWCHRRYGSACPHQPAGAERHVPVDVLVEKIAERLVAGGDAGLRTEGAKPHHVAGADIDPVGVQKIASVP